MKRSIQNLAKMGVLFGVDVSKLMSSLVGVPPYLRDYVQFVSSAKTAGVRALPMGVPIPCLLDRTATSGTASGAYFHQDLLVAQRIYQRAPRRHVDIGSRVDGFVAHVASFRPIDVVDIRPLYTSAANIHFIRSDVLRLSGSLIGTSDSVSCLHALEHFGLGRYGDPISADAHERGWEAIASLVEPGGWIYLSVPIGVKQCVKFNAHRVFTAPGVRSLIGPNFRVHEFHYVDDEGELHLGAPTEGADYESTFGLVHGCGIFELQRG